MNKGSVYLAQAEKLLEPSSFLDKMVFRFNEEERKEKAAEAFKQAATALKMENNYEKAALCFRKAAKHYSLPFEITTATTVAADCDKRAGHIVKSIKTYEKAVQLSSETGNMSKAAKCVYQMAEMFEEEDKMLNWLF
jgi:tetratricopeptide (TPR) repeat protein